MSKCIRCDIEIYDDTHVCPLCNGVVEQSDELSGEAGGSQMYPDVRPSVRKLKFFIKLFIFLSIIAEAVLILINSLTYKGFSWSLISGIVLAYACFTVMYALRNDQSHRRKLWGEAIAAMVLVGAIDAVTGARGWSVNYVIPSIILAVDGAILIFMIANHRHWQNYLLLQVMMVFISVVFVVFAAFGIIKHPLLTIIAAVISGIALTGSLIFGDKKAFTELSRRFRI